MTVLLPCTPSSYRKSNVLRDDGVTEIEFPVYAPTNQGTALRNLRKRLGLTLREAARRCKMTMTDLSAIEAGRAIFTDSTQFGTALKRMEEE